MAFIENYREGDPGHEVQALSFIPRRRNFMLILTWSHLACSQSCLASVRSAQQQWPRSQTENESWARVEDLEKNHDNLDGRVGRLELQHERESAYRYPRVEHAQGLTSLFKHCEDGTLERANLRVEGAKSLVEEVAKVVARDCDEEALQQAVVKGKAGIADPHQEARRVACVEGLEALHTGLLEWIQPAGRPGCYSFRLAGGEPSRLLSEGVRKDLNWVVYVLGKREKVPT